MYIDSACAAFEVSCILTPFLLNRQYVADVEVFRIILYHSLLTFQQRTLPVRADDMGGPSWTARLHLGAQCSGDRDCYGPCLGTYNGLQL